MERLFDYLDVLLGVLKHSYGVFAGVIVDSWNGEGNRSKVGSRTLSCSNVVINADATVGPYGWLNLSYCGQPRLTLEMLTTGYNERDITVEIQYGQRIYSGMQVILKQRDRNSAPVEYSPNTGIFDIRMYRDRGQFARIKSIKNNSSAGVTISAWSQSTVKPLLVDIETLERDVIEGD